MTGSEISPVSTPSWVTEGHFGVDITASSDQELNSPASATQSATPFKFRSRHGSDEISPHQRFTNPYRTSNNEVTDTSSITPRTPGAGWEDYHEEDVKLKASSFKIWLMSTLNRVLVLYHSGKYVEALPIIDHAFQRADDFGEVSMFPRTALWRAIILDKVDQGSEVPKMLAYTVALDFRLTVDPSDPDRVRLLEMLTKYSAKIDIWSDDAKKNGTASQLIPSHSASVYIKGLEADFERNPRLAKSPAVLRKWVLHQRGELASQSSWGPGTGSISDTALMTPPSAPEAHQQILRLIVDKKPLEDIVSNLQQNSISEEETPLGRDITDQGGLSPAQTDESLFQNLLAKVKIPNLKTAIELPSARGLPLRQSQPESPPSKGQMTRLLEDLRRGEDNQRRMHAAPNVRSIISLDKSKEPAAEVQHIPTRKQPNVAYQEAVVQKDMRGSSNGESERESKPIARSEVSQHSSPKDRKVTLSAPEDAVLTDTPGGTKLEDFIERRKSIEERRRSLSSIETNLSNLDLRHATGYPVSPTSDRRTSIDQSIPSVKSPLRRSSLVSDLDDGKDGGGHDGTPLKF